MDLFGFDMKSVGFDLHSVGVNLELSGSGLEWIRLAYLDLYWI